MSIFNCGVIGLVDGYKTDHRSQYPDKTQLVNSNWTPRGSRISGIDKAVHFGIGYAIQEYLVKEFNKFFAMDKEKAVARYKRRLDNYAGKGRVSVKHMRELHDLQYLPVAIRALPEGTRVPLGVPMFTIENTLPEFFWLTNSLETLLSTTIWGPCTTATLAHRNRQLLDWYAEYTGADKFGVNFQAHDFSMRGMFGIEAAKMSGAAHLLSSYGTDTLPAIDFLEDYYGANSDVEMVGGGVFATEHSVMCMGGSADADEFETYRRLICDIYPDGILSIVSDTWDLWNVITNILPRLKDEIMSRDGTVVIRPDSGDPVLIVCGDPAADPESPEGKGVVQLLWEIFGGTVNEKGYKVLDSHIGAIYGDGITNERMDFILAELAVEKFCSSNIVFGIGSFSYQYNTRDTFNFAMKATAGMVDGEYREIYKDPKTGDGSKKSARGFIRVDKVDGELVATYPVSHEESKQGEMELIFDGKNGLVKQYTLAEIRETLHGKSL